MLRRRGVWGCTYSLPLLPSFLVLSTQEMVAVRSPLLSLAIFKWGAGDVMGQGWVEDVSWFVDVD